jgi:hypothetical protein
VTWDHLFFGLYSTSASGLGYQQYFRDISFDITTGHGLGSWGSIPDGARDFFSTTSRPAMGSIEPPFPSVKRPGREADHSPPSSGGVRNSGAIPPYPHTSSQDFTYSVLTLVTHSYSNTVIMFMIRHSASCGGSEGTHLCCLHSHHLFFCSSPTFGSVERTDCYSIDNAQI